MVDNRQLQELLDKQAITEVLYRYCRGVDRGDVALLASVYHDDGIDDHGFWKGLGKDFAVFINGMLLESGSGNCQHMISNVLIELDGDVAFVESYSDAVRDTGTHRESVQTRYLDRFERRLGEWRIAHRLVVRDLHHMEERRPIYSDEEWNIRSPGRRDRLDPVYRLRSLGQEI
ncbi:nuclear transport factor 2 family protein [Novosphingobium sp.]|uniref:nuclear transport factor 2 family protein n=1 Tax=Novosphingobium sp. TaxID=1874826 RepID=UPI00286D8167|nr:nuclear transport factor 2 family protein [Novosphingobium sp.]